MHIIVVGLNYKTTPVELRERVSIQDFELEDVVCELTQTHTVLESVVVSTCNRTEIYAVVSSVRSGEDYLRARLAKRAGLSRAEMASYLYLKEGQDAVLHLMRVTCGLDSMVIGETQILGQVRSSFLVAQDAGATGVLLNQLFRRTIQVGKRAQSETEIGQKAVSVSYAAVQLAKKIYGNLSHCRALVLGAGKMSWLTAQHLQAAGVQEIVVANRTLEKAQALASAVGGQSVKWDKLGDALAVADLVITSTGSLEPVLSKDAVARAQASRKRKSVPLTLIDIAVPRDIAPEVGLLKNLYLYDIDDLEGVVEANLAEREREAELVSQMIVEAIRDFTDWLAEQEVVPLITAIRAKGVDIQASVMKSLEQKLPELTDRQRKLIHKHTMSIVNQLLRDPIQNMKELAIASGGSRHVRIFAELFGVSSEDLSVSMPILPPLATEVGGKNRPSTTAGFVDFVRQWTETLLSDKPSVEKPHMVDQSL